MSNSFKIGDTIKPISEYPQEARGIYGFEKLKGQIVGFLREEGENLVIIEDQFTYRQHTVNANIYEITEAK